MTKDRMFEEDLSRRTAEIEQWRERAQTILDHARRVAEQAHEREIRCIGPKVVAGDRSEAESARSRGARDETRQDMDRTGSDDGQDRDGRDSRARTNRTEV